MKLIERLRELGFGGSEIGHEAADELERLEATISRLKGDLRSWEIAAMKADEAEAHASTQVEASEIRIRFSDIAAAA